MSYVDSFILIYAGRGLFNDAVTVRLMGRTGRKVSMLLVERK
jgi:hypothetical protein